MARAKNPDLVIKTIYLRRQDVEFARARAAETAIPYQAIIRAWIARAADRDRAAVDRERVMIRRVTRASARSNPSRR